MTDECITTRDAAALLDVSIEHVSWLLRRGVLKGEKFGVFWMVDRASVEGYRQANRKPGPKKK